MATFDYPYRKSVNITAWVLQIIVCLILLAASAWVMTIVNNDNYDQDLDGYTSIFTAAAGIQIAITALTIVLDIVEMVLIGRRRMQPWLYLTFAAVKTLIWGIMFILNLISLSALSIILSAILAGTSILQLIYGAMLVHRKRRGTLRGGNYAPAVNPANNNNGGGGGVETGFGGGHVQGPVYDSPVPTYGNSNININNTPNYYQPQPHSGTEYKSPSTVTYGQEAQAPGSYELDNQPQRYA